jgi:predicted AAA+ superfamily ATPase
LPPGREFRGADSISGEITFVQAYEFGFGQLGEPPTVVGINLRHIQARRPEILYWRTATGEEVDFVIETPSRVIPIEVKAAARISPSDARGLESYLTEYDTSSDGGLMLYGGDDIYPLTKRVLAVPWWAIC